MKTLLALLGCAVLSAGLAGAARAEDRGNFEFAVASDSREDLSGRSTFPAEAMKVFIVYKVEMSKPATLKAVWWAEKAESLADNTKINDSFAKLGAGTFMSTFAFKPNRPWPVGSYRVDLYIDDKHEKTVRFKVAK